MNIGENKKVIALSAVFALAFGGVMYFGYQSTQNAAAAEEKLQEIDITFQDLNAADYPPTANSEKILEAATEKVSALKNDLEGQLGSYAKAANVNSSMSAVEFQNALQKAIAALAERAKTDNVKLGTQAAAFGMASYQNNAALQTEVPYRDFLLRAVDHTVSLLLDAKAPAIEKVYCAALPSEATPDLSKAPEYFPLNFELSFDAKRGTLPELLNNLLNDKQFFYTVTGISSESNITIADADKYVAPPEEIEVAGEEEEEEITEEELDPDAPAPVVRVLATRKLGNPEETVHVHLNLQVLFFTPTVNKK